MNSIEEERLLLHKAARCLTIDSHKINRNIITETIDTTDPILATTFQ